MRICDSGSLHRLDVGFCRLRWFANTGAFDGGGMERVTGEPQSTVHNGVWVGVVQ